MDRTMRLAAMVLLVLAGCDDQDLIHTPPAPRPDASWTPDGARDDKVDGGAACQTEEDCDDSDDCTLDECLENGTCGYSPKACCGDRVCDDGEECVTCPMDCCVCCKPHTRAQCRDQAIEECVCAALPSCCTDVWDQECVNAVDASECGTCDCCTAHTEPDCADQEVSACVCDFDPDCCSIEWTASCVDVVPARECGTCP